MFWASATGRWTARPFAPAQNKNSTTQTGDSDINSTYVVLACIRIYRKDVTATRLGLVNRLIPQDKFMDEVYAYANELAESVSPRSTRVIKRQVYEGMFQTLGEALDTASEEMRASLQCEDFKEGVAHFVEKRAPVFTGR